jgi:hypothetical protein
VIAVNLISLLQVGQGGKIGGTDLEKTAVAGMAHSPRTLTENRKPRTNLLGVTPLQVMDAI